MTGETATHCPYCSLQCGINLMPRPDGTVELTGREDFPVNRGGLCLKGAGAAELTNAVEQVDADRTPGQLTASLPS